MKDMHPVKACLARASNPHDGWEINPLLTSNTVKHTSLFTQLSNDPSATN